MRRLFTPRWLLGHALVWLAVAAFLALGWWQAGRAAEGNALSWAYTVEWPLFAVFLLVLWIKEIRQALRREVPEQQARQRQGPVITRREAPVTDDDDPELAAYNRYLASTRDDA